MLVLFGAALTPDAELTAVVARYHKVNTINGVFEQTMCSEEMGYCQTFSGRFTLARPDKFRFDIEEPFRQVMVGDSQDLWIYLPESSLARHTAGVVNPFFEMLLNSSTDVFRAESISIEEGQFRLTLLPADSLASFQRIILLLNPDDHSINDIEMDDGYGNKTRYSLSAVKYNTKIPDKTFKFVPPRGTTIVE